MTREVERQRQVLDLLNTIPVVSPDLIAQLRQQQEAQPPIVEMDKLAAE